MEFMGRFYKRNTIAGKIVLCVSISLVVVMSLYMLITMGNEYRNNLKALEEKVAFLSKVASISLSNPVWNYNDEAIESAVEALFQDREVGSLVVRDYATDEVLVSNSPRDSDEMVYATKEIFHNEEAIGSLQLGLTTQYIKAELAAHVVGGVVQIVILMAVLMMVVTFISKHITKPLGQLTLVAEALSDGDLDVRASVTANDEVGELSKGFNLMADTLQKKIKELTDTSLELEESIDKIRELTYFDSVTDLPNHRALYQHFIHLTSEKRRIDQEEGLFIVVVEAGGVRNINENYGYQKGNQLLRGAARRMNSFGMEETRVYRGTSNDLVMCTRSFKNKEAIEGFMKELIAEMNRPYEMDGQFFVLNFSVGISSYPAHGKELDSLLKNAGFAKNIVRERKNTGVLVYDDAVRKEKMAETEMEEELLEALEKEELYLEYQPIIEMSTGAIRGMEALARWKHPQKGFIPPDRFIPLAEKTGLIHPLGKWVIKEALSQQAAWKDHGYPNKTISINVSMEQFEAKDFLRTMEQQLKDSGVEAQEVELELTESAVIHKVQESVAKLNALREMGIRIAIDDFGTGYSSLSYLVKLPIDTIKIDRSFVMNAEKNHHAKSIATAIIAMAKSLKLHMVAEGIETREQLEFLQQEGCHWGQGYFFSRPLGAHQVQVLLQGGEIFSIRA